VRFSRIVQTARLVVHVDEIVHFDMSGSDSQGHGLLGHWMVVEGLVYMYMTCIAS